MPKQGTGRVTLGSKAEAHPLHVYSFASRIGHRQREDHITCQTNEAQRGL